MVEYRQGRKLALPSIEMKGRRTMKMKRFLAILLVLAMCLTTLGVVPAMAVEPAAEESDDAISARWTDKDSLPPRGSGDHPA